MANLKSYKGEIICKKCGTEMIAKGWSASEGHIWICPQCKTKKFEFNPTKGEVIYSDTDAPRKRKKKGKNEQ